MSGIFGNNKEDKFYENMLINHDDFDYENVKGTANVEIGVDYDDCTVQIEAEVTVSKDGVEHATIKRIYRAYNMDNVFEYELDNNLSKFLASAFHDELYHEALDVIIDSM